MVALMCSSSISSGEEGGGVGGREVMIPRQPEDMLLSILGTRPRHLASFKSHTNKLGSSHAWNPTFSLTLNERCPGRGYCRTAV